MSNEEACEYCGAARDPAIPPCPRCSRVPSLFAKAKWAEWLPRFRTLSTATISATSVLVVAMLFLAPVVGVALSLFVFVQYWAREYLNQRCKGEETTLFNQEVISTESALEQQRFYDLYAAVFLIIAVVASYVIALHYVAGLRE